MIHCGFFNAVDGDRKYDAEQMGSIFDGIIQDGVYMTIGDRLSVKAGTGMNVIVGTGRAWFNHTWTINDSEEVIEIEQSPVSEIISRIDAVVLEVNKSDETRNNTFKVIKGIEAESPEKPELLRSENINDYALAYITLKGGVTSITNSMIEIVVGTSETPYVTAPLEKVDIDVLLKQWESEFDEMIDKDVDEYQALTRFFKDHYDHDMDAYNKQFRDWFESVRYALVIDSNVAVRLEGQIQAIRPMTNDMVDKAIVHSVTKEPYEEDTWPDFPTYEEEFPLYPGTNPDDVIIEPDDEDNN